MRCATMEMSQNKGKSNKSIPDGDEERGETQLSRSFVSISGPSLSHSEPERSHRTKWRWGETVRLLS